ncbi:hypothetical protein PoB_007496500 [Plakobranchus ocellatus]|uniref:Uncharacterized protein n=1 Tax=Plakobranchus ocellatus TaxID=259542 RepID=A0AAV4DWC7_9GAST|nr:hypothetical protein PoB_007496500 [Plakobranchus ocellatus]
MDSWVSQDAVRVKMARKTMTNCLMKVVLRRKKKDYSITILGCEYPRIINKHNIHFLYRAPHSHLVSLTCQQSVSSVASTNFYTISGYWCQFVSKVSHQSFSGLLRSTRRWILVLITSGIVPHPLLE